VLEKKSGNRLVLCPRCGQEVRWTPACPFRPFCSERCKLIDLGEWAAERYRIPLQSDPDSMDDPDAHERGAES
jgi:endogenous inhibitor of DNA gyrase (YacG/DUF329 family)